MTIDGCLEDDRARSVAVMDTRNLGYLGLGVLAATAVATLIGVPPIIWLSVVLAAVAIVIVLLVVIRRARSDGSDDATRMLAHRTLQPTTTYGQVHSDMQRVKASESP